MFESFAFKRGIPGDADYVFDVRMLPNPHYEPELKALTGKDDAVIAFFQRHDQVHQMLLQIAQFLDQWLDPLANDNRSYVTVAIGCTGGQHRSVYLVEELTKSVRRPLDHAEPAPRTRRHAGAFPVHLVRLASGLKQHPHRRRQAQLRPLVGAKPLAASVRQAHPPAVRHAPDAGAGPCGSAHA